MFNAVLYSSTDCFKSVIIKVSLEHIAEGYEVFDKSDYANKLPSNAHIVATYAETLLQFYRTKELIFWTAYSLVYQRNGLWSVSAN